MNDSPSRSLALSTSKTSLLKLAEEKARIATYAAKAAIEAAEQADLAPEAQQRLKEAARTAVAEMRLARERVRKAKEQAHEELVRRAREVKLRQQRMGLDEPTILPNRRRSQGLTLPNNTPSTDARAFAPFLLMCEHRAEEDLLKALIREGDLAVVKSQLLSQTDGLPVEIRARVKDLPVDIQIGQRVLIFFQAEEIDDSQLNRNRQQDEILKAQSYIPIRLTGSKVEDDPYTIAASILRMARRQ